MERMWQADTDLVLRRSGARLASVLKALATVPCPQTRSARIAFEDELREDRSVHQLRLHIERLEKAVHGTLAREKRTLSELRGDLGTLDGGTLIDAFRLGYAQGG